MHVLTRFLIIYAVIRPVFYIYSYSAARISDLAVLILGIILLLAIRKIPKISSVYFLWFLLFEFLICFTLLINSFLFELTLRDFVETVRPVYLLVGTLLGISFVRGKIDKLDNLIKVVMALSILSSLIGLIQYVFDGSVVSNFFYKLYSVPNLLTRSYPSGLMYMHYEYTAFSFLAPLFFIPKFFVSKKKKYILPILIFTALSILSRSKGGIVFSVIAILSFFVFYTILSPKKFYGFFASLKLFFKIGLPLLILISVLVYFCPYLYYGFQDFFHLNVASISIGQRVDDILIIKEWILKDGLHFLVGYSPLRSYPDISYIEESFFHILFRFGVIGIFLYYFFFLFPVLKFMRVKNFIFKTDRGFFSQCIIMISIVSGLFIADFTANLSQSIKLSFIIAVILGGFISVLQAIESRKRASHKSLYENNRRN